MEMVQTRYPIFEANQVLTHSHLNEVFDYLDNQERLTRSRLIGIGIVCGLEVRLDTATSTIHLAKGCGVTSQGYLIVEPEDVSLAAYRDYVMPAELDYRQFKDASSDPKKQYPLWELFPAGEPGTKELSGPAGFLNDKAVLLFWELRRDELQNCVPNNCDDAGTEVTGTLRRLLIKTSDLTKIVAEAQSLGSGVTPADIDDALQEKLSLPDLQLARVDVPNTAPMSSQRVLAAFQEALKVDGVAVKLGEALTAAYDAFKPLLEAAYPSNPFANFAASYGFLNDAPQTLTDATFIQYYWDLFDDLIAAYNEFRWKGADLLCACCPDEDLFPRHLMLGPAAPSTGSPTTYRHSFLPSPAVSDCDGRRDELVQLFRRLAGMASAFTNSPVPEAPDRRTDKQIRVTPSMLGDVTLSAKAIPYYYQLDGTPPLYEVWDSQKTRRNRANQNLGYRSDEYRPPAPAFITDALRYDLEPHNFLRIEGHLGKNVNGVLRSLLELKSRYRLPVEFIALRTGAFDENVPVDLKKEKCWFDDIETLYRTLSADLTCFLCKEVEFFYDLDLKPRERRGEAVKPKLPLLVQCAPDFLVKPGTFGQQIEEWLAEPSPIGPFVRRIPDVIGVPDSGRPAWLLGLIARMSRLAEEAAPELAQLDFEVFEGLYQGIAKLAETLIAEADNPAGDDPLGSELLYDRLRDIVFRCRLDPFQALVEEYKRRVREIKQQQFLSFFLQKNPGIQHKAGVPFGGTFILVYHESPTVRAVSTSIDTVTGEVLVREVAGEGEKAIATAVTHLMTKADILADPDVHTLVMRLAGRGPRLDRIRDDVIADIYTKAVGEMVDGTVIADFFLPYICCSDCAPIQYRLPGPPLGFSVDLDCTNEHGLAKATVTPQGASGNVFIKVDDGRFEALSDTLVLSVGSHMLVIRDDMGTESELQTIEVPEPLSLGEPVFQDDLETNSYSATFVVSGGTPPYVSGAGPLAGSEYTVSGLRSGAETTVKLADSAGCTTELTFTHSVCDLPCGGAAIKTGYRFWLDEPIPSRRYRAYEARVERFHIELADGESFDLNAEVQGIIQANANDLNANFSAVVDRWLKGINELIERKVGSSDWFRLSREETDERMTGALWIERLQCIRFAVDIVARFGYEEENDVSVATSYTQTGTSVANERDDWKAEIPAFDGIESNKCNPDQPPVPLCKEVDLNLTVRRELREGGVQLSVSTRGTDAEGSFFLWEAPEGASPPLANGPRAAFRFRQLPEGPFRLTAFTKLGCRVIRTVELNR